MKIPFPGYRDLKNLLRGRAPKNVSRETLQDNAALYLGWKKLKEKLTTRRTRKKLHLFVKKKISLKNELNGQKGLHRGHHQSDRFINKAPPQFFTNHTQGRIANAGVPKASWIKHLTSEPIGDFDEIVTEEGTASRNTIHDEALLEKLMKNADHSDLDENEDVAPRYRSTLGNNNQTKGYKGDSAIKGRIANGRDRPDEGQNKTKQVSNNTTLSQKEDDDDDGDEQEAEEDEKEDGSNINQVINDEEEQLLHLMNEKFQDKNQKIKPVAISDQMNQAPQALMSSFQERQHEIEASVQREKQLEAMREFQTKQAMLQQLQLSYAGNTGAQNTAQVPQYLGPQLWRAPEAPLRTPLVLGPPAPIYQPAYMGPSPNASPLPERNNQGYTINVDGLKGVFSKGPGFAVRFHSPDSEVTVVKRSIT